MPKPNFDHKPLGSYAALKQQANLPKNQSHATVNHQMAEAFAKAMEKKEGRDA